MQYFVVIILTDDLSTTSITVASEFNHVVVSCSGTVYNEC